MQQKNYSIVAIYDTETTNIGSGIETRAFPVLFIVDDISGIDLADYQPGRDDNIKFFRYEKEMLEYIDMKIAMGRQGSFVPVIAAYNLMFDLQPLMYMLSRNYKIVANAQSSQNVYTLDLCDGNGDVLLRFWDTWFLEMRGLRAMGETCGLEKADGDWDYSLIRNQETYLTKEEMHYAARDVQVIPAYLKYLLKANEWLSPNDFGIRVLTKTSLVRKMAEREIGNLKVEKKNGKKLTLGYAFQKRCEAQMPKIYKQYALRRTCFRGGLTFTSAKYASKVVTNVASLDVTSMHHAFINGVRIPRDFELVGKRRLEIAYEQILSRDLQFVLEHYDHPFDYACHMQIRFDNIRLKENTCFKEWGIATLSYSKFKPVGKVPDDLAGFNERHLFAEMVLKSNGWYDRALNPTFAYGKLYAADVAFLHLTEIELWMLNEVYEWDSHECIMGEITRHFIVPPDYVTLQSNLLYRMKNDVKQIVKHYHRGTPYEYEIPDTIPDGIKWQLEKGVLSEDFLQSYYTSTVKGMFNSIYGTMAQDIYKPDFGVDECGNLEIDKETVTREDNWLNKQPRTCKVLYQYGMRIVGGSRLHLVIAMEMLYMMLGDKIRVTGGDTDSIKISCDDDITDDILMEMLAPLHDSITDAINRTQSRIRELFPNIASDLRDVGCFEVEDCGGSTRYKLHMEAWNKARISIDVHDRVHVTCAGLRRPDGEYHIERFTEDLLKVYSPEVILPLVLGYNTFVDPTLSFALEKHIPKAQDYFNREVVDYRGHKAQVYSHESQSLYDTGRWFGNVEMDVNRKSVKYKRETYGERLDVNEKILRVNDAGNPCIYINGNLAYEGVRNNDGQIL